MNEPIRILHVCQRMEAAGLQSFIMNIYRNIDKTKVQFDFLVHYKEKQFYDNEIEQLGGRVFKLSVREDYNIIKYWRELNNFFKTNNYDIVHGHMDTLGAVYLLAAKRNGIKVRIAHAHTDYVQSGIKKIPRLAMISLFKRNANYLFACSKQSGKFMYKQSDFMIYRNAIDVDKYAYNQITRANVRERLGIKDCIVLGHVGRFNEVKNHDFIFTLLKKLIPQIPNIKLLLIGGGELESHINKRISELNLKDYVIVLKNRSDVEKLYQAMDLFLLPSLFEGIPLVGVEAQSSGLPCLFSDRVNKEVSVTNNAFFLSIDNGTEVWEKKIIDICRNYVRMDQTNEVKNKGYDSKNVARQLEQFYLEVSKIYSLY